MVRMLTDEMDAKEAKGPKIKVKVEAGPTSMF